MSLNVGRVLLAEQTASADATLDFDNVFDSTYDIYEIEIIGVVPGTDNQIFEFKLGTGATPTYQTTLYDWSASITAANASITIVEREAVADAHVELSSGSGVGNGSGESISCTIKLYSLSNAALRTLGSYNSIFLTAAASQTGSTYGHFTRQANEAHTSCRFEFASGNVASGTIKVYGVR